MTGVEAVPALGSGVRCRVCSGVDLFVFMERLGVPVHPGVPRESALAARAVPRGDLRLACCRSCGFVTNLTFEPGLLRDGRDRENDQAPSATLAAHTESVIGGLLEGGCRKAFVLEIGSGQGAFLRRLCAEGGNRGLGFDAAYRGAESVDDGRVTFSREIFRGQRSGDAPDLVLGRHVLEHVPDPMRLLNDVVDSLRDGQGARVAFELRAADFGLDEVMFHDFAYERPSYFTAASLRFALEHAGLTAVAVTPTFGRQHVWATAEYTRGRSRAVARLAPGEAVKSIERYLLREPAARAAVRLMLEDLSATGRVATWGAGSKGATFLSLVDPRCELVDCVVDANPNKQGMFVAGTGHAIVSHTDLSARGVRHVLVMNRHYLDEVRRTVHANNPDLAVVDWNNLGPSRERAQDVKPPRAADDPNGPSAHGDPIQVFRSALADRARWDRLFREANLSLKEVDRIRHTIARARGLEAGGSSRDDRALDRLLEGRPDWFERLLSEPSKVPSNLRAALAEVAATLSST